MGGGRDDAEEGDAGGGMDDAEGRDARGGRNREGIGKV